MTLYQAYFGLIQYQPDSSRQERANIGLLLFCPQKDFFRVQTIRRFSRIKAFFRAVRFDGVLLKQALRSFEASLLQIKENATSTEECLEQIEHFSKRSANDLRLVSLRFVRVQEPEADFDALYHELVEVEAKKETKTEAPFFRKIDSIFHDQNIAKNVLFNQSFDIPILGRKLEVPYAYQNGCLNLVKPTSFSTRESLALSQAEKLAVQGKLIQEHSTRDEEKALIIIPDIAQAKTEEKILQLFRSFDIRCVHPTTLQDFEDEIRQTIKALPNPT